MKWKREKVEKISAKLFLNVNPLLALPSKSFRLGSFPEQRVEKCTH